LSAGFDEAQGSIVISLDGDLQHDPADIPALLAKIDEGYDIASGWRNHRLDNAITRKIPSRIANWMMAKASGVDLHDFGTTFKAYRAEVLKEIHLYGELHRFIPALASFYVSIDLLHPTHALLWQARTRLFYGGQCHPRILGLIEDHGPAHHDGTWSVDDGGSAAIHDRGDDVLDRVTGRDADEDVL
jgi:glycosyltransferase involved in cell wall biosynthesis